MQDAIFIYKKRKIGDIVYLLVSFMFFVASLYILFFVEGKMAFSILSFIFWGVCFGVGIHQFCRKPGLVINEYGINVSSNGGNDTILWKNIEGFRVGGKGCDKWIAIDIDNTEDWWALHANELESELSAEILEEYNSLFIVSSSHLEISHKQLLEILEEGLKRYRNSI